MVSREKYLEIPFIIDWAYDGKNKGLLPGCKIQPGGSLLACILPLPLPRRRQSISVPNFISPKKSSRTSRTAITSENAMYTIQPIMEEKTAPQMLNATSSMIIKAISFAL